MKTPNNDEGEFLTIEQMREETLAHLHVDSVFDDPEFKQILNDPTNPLHPAVLAKHKEAFPHLYSPGTYTAQISEVQINPETNNLNLSFKNVKPVEPTKSVSFWNEEFEQVSEPIPPLAEAMFPYEDESMFAHKTEHRAPELNTQQKEFYEGFVNERAISEPLKIPLPTPQNNTNQYPSIGLMPNAPSTSEFLPTIAPLAQIQTPIALPANLIDIPRAELPTICGHIRNNRSSLPSNPNWNAQLDTQFEVCVEMVTFIESVAGQFPTYLRLPHIQHDGYSQREEVHTMEFIAGKLQFGLFENKTGQYEKCRTVWGAVTSAYQAALSYKKHDELYTKESINQMLIDNDKMARKLERALPKEAKVAPVKVTVDRTAYDEVHKQWKAAIANKKKVILELDEIISDLNYKLKQEKIKAGITR